MAKTAYRELQATYRGSAYALALRGEARFQNKQYAEALQFYRAAAERMPELRGLHSALSSVYAGLDQATEAAEEERLEHSRGVPDCVREPHVCDFLNGAFEKLIADVSKDSEPESLYWRARGSRELANRFCNERNSDPDSVETYKRKAEDLDREHRYGEAAVEWRNALQNAPRDASLRNSLGSALFNTQNFRSVLPELQKLLASDGSSANLNFFVGDALFETEHPEQAIPLLSQALKQNPRLVPAQVAIGMSYLRLGQAAKAIPHLRAGISLDHDGSLYYQLARAYQLTKQPARAKRMLEESQRRRGRGVTATAQ